MLKERWEKILRDYPDRIALIEGGRSYCFRDLQEKALKLEPHSDAEPDGTTPRPVRAEGGLFLLSHIIAGILAEAPIQIVEKDRVPHAVPQGRPPPEGTALVKQTVGGSGVRRAQYFTGTQVLNDVDVLFKVLDLKARGVGVAAVSLAHSYGLSTLIFQCVFNAVPIHIVEQPFPALVQQAINAHTRVYVPGVPFLWKTWDMAGLSFDSICLAISAASPLSKNLEGAYYQKHKLKLHNLYGASECGAITYDDSPALRREEGYAGRQLPGVRLALDDEKRIVVHGPSVGIGYETILPGENYGGGCFRTPDKGCLDAAGGCHLLSYEGAAINVAGRKLSPSEIEGKIVRSTGLKDVSVSGRPSRDPERVYDLVLDCGLPREALTQELKERICRELTPWEIPRIWRARAS